MDIVRINCVEVDTGDAAHIGGPVLTRYRSFDMKACPVMIDWLMCGDQWRKRSITSVEVIKTTTP